MIRVEKFQISRNPYALRLDSFRRQVPDAGPLVVDAVWFRRKAGVTSAHLGQIWGYGMFGDRAPTDVQDFLARLDGRYGGNCHGRWDGRGYWGSEEPDAQAAHLEILRPMLESFPEAPDGYDAWWVNA